MSKPPLPKPTLRTMKVTELSIDPRIQRDLVRRQLESMSGDNYDAASLGTLVVSRRANGSHVILDGQHRWTVVTQYDGDRELECRVYEGLTFEQEADLFLAFNNQSAVNSLAKFNAGVIAGRDGPVVIKEILDKYGLEVGTGQQQFSAVVTAMRVITWRDGLKLLDNTLDLLTAAWSPLNNDKSPSHLTLEARVGNIPYRGVIVEGLARLLHRYNNAVNRARMIEALTAHGSRAPERIANDAVALKNAMAKTSGAEAVAQVLVRLYNSQHGGPRLPRWELDVDDDLGNLAKGMTFTDLMNGIRVDEESEVSVG